MGALITVAVVFFVAGLACMWFLVKKGVVVIKIK